MHKLEMGGIVTVNAKRYRVSGINKEEIGDNLIVTLVLDPFQ